MASNVLHATVDITVTLNNVNKLLKPGGKLALMEGVGSPPPSFMPYSLLSGWWLFEDEYRQDGPLLTKDAWNSALKATGFSGIDGCIDDYPGRSEQLFSAMWSTRLDEESSQKKSQSIMVYRCSSDSESERFSNDLNSQLDRPSMISDLSHHSEVHPDIPCIILDGPSRSIFNDLSSEQYSRLKDILLKCRTLLWVLPHSSTPEASMIKGLLRTLRLELPTSNLVVLELDTPFDGEVASAVVKLIDHIERHPNSHTEQEYLLVDNILHVPRLERVEATKEIFAIEAGVAVKNEEKLWQDNSWLEMTIDVAGSPDSVHFRHNHPSIAVLGNDEVQIDVDAAGLNFIDLLTILGTLSWSPPGLEGSGIVTEIGSKVEGFQVGDRVFYVLEKGGMATTLRLPSAYVHRIPKELSAIEAASLPVAYSTALMSLVDVARLRKGESVLIHSASGGTGQACVQVAQHLGAEIYATAGTPEKREFLTAMCGIPAHRIFSSRSADFKDGVLKATGNRGVDVIVNSLSGDLLQQTWSLIAENGRFLEIGKKDFHENTYLPMRNFAPNVTFSGIDLRRTIAKNPSLIQKYLSTITGLIEGGNITPIFPISAVSALEVKTGLRKLQAGQNIGKIVVTFGKNENAVVQRPSPLQTALITPTLLRPDATYVIAGGTGGIGRALVPWMIAKGAKNVIMLGRSAMTNSRVKAIVKQYEGTDICVKALPCDVGTRSDILRAREALQSLPKVCGIIHGAICLRDSIFANLDYKDWQLTYKSRVEAAWNLHELFPNLDFFVLFGGMTGVVGNIGQSVYTGTSTSLEAFTDYRLKQGLHAAIIQLPPVTGIGLVAERNMISQLKRTIGCTLRGNEVLTEVEGAIIGENSGIGVDGKVLGWSVVSTSEAEVLPWEHFQPLGVLMRERMERAGTGISGGNANQGQSELKTGSSEAVLDTLSEKISVMTTIDREEITPTRDLSDYGLDSLISLELRNWIRRTFNFDMHVDEITKSKNLQAISDAIFAKSK
ncbi:unnamed protein product [Periconia digitata]|uniref:Carrier domain-containing protein n=1 Tax=Periconia digitata TaxID=1303443 RepID=A0A9W4UMY4_9PLEO|nr:unnamed protein product [Periconia digitata]